MQFISAHSNSQSQDIFWPILGICPVNFSFCLTKLILAAMYIGNAFESTYVQTVSVAYYEHWFMIIMNVHTYNIHIPLRSRDTNTLIKGVWSLDTLSSLYQ